MNEKSKGFFEIAHKNKTIAHLYDLNLFEDSSFPTPPEMELQFGYGFIKESKILDMHIHKKVRRQTINTSEFLFVISGKMKVEILAEDKTSVKRVELTNNQCLLQFIGGHKISFEANTKYFEIKQGPYLGRDKDKLIIK